MKTFRFAASWFSDVRSYEWDLLVSEVSGDLAYTVAIERFTASRSGRPPAPTALRLTHVSARKHTDSGGEYTATSSHPANGGDLTHTDGCTNAYFLIINRLALLLV